MPRRWGEQTRLFVYAYLCERDGERCSRCGKRPATLYNGKLAEPPASLNEKLEIDHLNGDPHDNRYENLRLLCKRCNIIVRNKNQSNHHSDVCVRKSQEGCPSTRVVKQVVDYSSGSAEMQANSQFELPLKAWLIQVVTEQEFLPKKSAINGGANRVGCSPETARRYIEKLTDPFGGGPFQEIPDALGIKMITWKDEFRPEKPEEIIQMDLDDFIDEPAAVADAMKDEQ